MDETLHTELLEMERLDRSLRAELVERGECHTGGHHPEMQTLHQHQNMRIRAILETDGWPGRSLGGEDGCRAAGFVVQHAILDPDLQQWGVTLLTQAVAQHEAEPFMLALLTDRVLMQVGQPQLSGTQSSDAEHGEVKPWTIANPETVDERCLTVGLSPLAENTARLNAQQHQEMDKALQREEEEQAYPVRIYNCCTHPSALEANSLTFNSDVDGFCQTCAVVN